MRVMLFIFVVSLEGVRGRSAAGVHAAGIEWATPGDTARCLWC
jgi:hypothetical protein